MDLTGNNLSDLPPQVNALTMLKMLKMSSNILETLPDLSALGALTTVFAIVYTYCCAFCLRIVLYGMTILVVIDPFCMLRENILVST